MTPRHDEAQVNSCRAHRGKQHDSHQHDARGRTEAEQEDERTAARDVIEGEAAAGDDVREEQEQRDDDDVVEHRRVRGGEEAAAR